MEEPTDKVWELAENALPVDHTGLPGGRNRESHVQETVDLITAAKQEGYEEAMGGIVSGKIDSNTLYRRSFEAGYEQGRKDMQHELAISAGSYEARISQMVTAHLAGVKEAYAQGYRDGAIQEGGERG
jgi:hypothetical protein